MKTAKTPTKRQRQIIAFIKKYHAKNGYPPTVRDIGAAVGLSSSATVHAHLTNLQQQGLLRRDPTKPRAIELFDRVANKARAAAAPTSLPLVGQVAAGSPILAEENIEEYVEVPPLVGGDSAEFLLRVRGDSMKDVGILEDDYVVVRKQETAENGEIVVALLDDGATVKRFFKERGCIRLQPENSALKPIRTKEVQIMGRVVGVMRQVG